MIERAGSPAPGSPNRASASRQASGPTPQLTPIASTPAAVSAADGCLGRRAVGQHEVLAEGHRGDDRHVRRPVGLVDGEQQVVEVEERLDHEQVDAALEQAVDLLPERRPDRGLVGVAELAGRRTQRADRAADPRVPAADVPGLAGDLGRPAVEARRVVGEAVGVEADPVGAEGQRLDEVGAGVEVLAVDRRDEVRAGRRQLVEARALRDPAPSRPARRSRSPRAACRRPAGAPRLAALATLNVGLFFVLLFVGAERLPGGVAATAGALAPIIVLLLGWPVLGMRPTAAALACGALGVVGVAALVLGPAAALDPLGLAAAAGATASMGVATVLARRWGPPPMPLLAFTAWQLLLGGAMIAPVALLAEGTPPVPTPRNLAGFAIIGLVGTALAFALWFRGLAALPSSSVAFLGLLSPIVATALGWAALGQSLTGLQLAGAVLVGASILAGQRATQPSSRGTATGRLKTRALPSQG